MRTLTVVAVLSASALVVPCPAAAADGGDGCHVEITARGEVIRSGNVAIGPGEHVRKVIALSGSVRVKAGATVEDVVALGGDVIVEGGAGVKGDATSVGGDVRLERSARVEGSATTVGGQLLVAEGAVLMGDRNSVQAEFDGVDLAQRALGAVSSALRDADCRIRIRQD